MPVGMEATMSAGSLLIATNPLSPREKAIALAPSSHQWFWSVPATTRRKLTMFRTYGSRCSHTHFPISAVSRLEEQVTGRVHPSASEGGPIEFPPGQLNAYVERIGGHPYGW